MLQYWLANRYDELKQCGRCRVYTNVTVFMVKKYRESFSERASNLIHCAGFLLGLPWQREWFENLRSAAQ
jgi:hypothetical protein